jgi:micrococcal nuclease
LAWWYRQYALDNTTLEQLEREARKAKKGLWVDSNAVAPWQWRRGKRQAR